MAEPEEIKNDTSEHVEEIGLIEDEDHVETIKEPADDECNEVEIKIVTETSRVDISSLPPTIDLQDLTAKSSTITKINPDGTETIETTITEFTTISDGNANDTFETKITTVTIESKVEDKEKAEEINNKVLADLVNNQVNKPSFYRIKT